MNNLMIALRTGLRVILWITARSLKNYHDAEHVEIDADGIPMLQVTVSEIVRNKAGEAITRANKRLRLP